MHLKDPDVKDPNHRRLISSDRADMYWMKFFLTPKYDYLHKRTWFNKNNKNAHPKDLLWAWSMDEAREIRE
jgi:hypothetical protein